MTGAISRVFRVCFPSKEEEPMLDGKKRAGRKKGMFEEGEMAPEFTLRDLEGRRVGMGELLQDGQHVLLVFLRHLG